MPTKLPNGITVGTVSSGTLRYQDLGPAFLSLLESINKDKAEEFKTFWPDVIEDEWEGEFVGEAIAELHDKINEVLPEGFYFGPTDGDGADFGIWQEAAPPILVRRKYEAEQVSGRTWAVHEYKDGSLMRSALGGLSKREAMDIAATINDAIARFISENGLDEGEGV